MHNAISQKYKLFETPPVEYSSSPLWVWNDMLTDEQITCNGKRIAARKRYHTLDYGLFEPFVLKQISRE